MVSRTDATDVENLTYILNVSIKQYKVIKRT